MKSIKSTDNTEQLNGSFSRNSLSLNFKKKNSKLFTAIILIFFSACFLSSQSADNNFQGLKDLSNDVIDSTNDIKGKTKPEISFYIADGFDALFSKDNIYSLEYNNDIYVEFEIPYKFYSFSFFLNNTFYLDFYELRYSAAGEPANYSDVMRSAFYDILLMNISNRFEFKNYIKLIADLYFSIDADFTSYLTLSFFPALNISGNYYSGFFWEIEEFYIIEKYFDESYYINSSVTYCRLGYEFFRFYGPKKFKWTIYFENRLKFKFPEKFYSNSFSNKFKFGIYFNFFGFKPSVNFIMNIYSNLEPLMITSHYIGFSAGLRYTYKWFTISLTYKGSSDIKLPYNNWFNEIEFYFKYSLSAELNDKK